MRTLLRPYPHSKDSGVMWLGRVPEHWDVLPHRALFHEINERGHAAEQMLSVTISQGIIRQKALLEVNSKKDSSNENKAAYKLVCPDDIAYNKMRAWQGAVGVSEFRGIVSPAYIVMRLRENYNSRYFHFLFRLPSFAKEAERWSYGITSDQWSLRSEDFKQIYSCVPPHEEQDAIVRFLTIQDSRFTRLIQVKRRMIELLNEQKSAVIKHVIMHGLTPNVPLKPSGVPWLGNIPNHWKVWQINRFARVGNGSTPSRANPSYWNDGIYPWLNSSCVNSEFVTEAKQMVTKAALQECHQNAACRQRSDGYYRTG